MNRIDFLFDSLRVNDTKALIGYITAGFPEKNTLEVLLPELEKAGLDLLEIGIPFSDPIADGPTIQRASQLSLAKGMTLKEVLDIVQRLRQVSQIPVVLMSYTNPILAMGIQPFFEAAKKVGVDGLIIPDIIPEEAIEFQNEADRLDIHLIYLVAPTTPDKRLKEVAAQTKGFLYAVSLTGVTGARQSISADSVTFLKRLRTKTKKPLAVGFGISTSEHVQALRPYVDAVIVGSALLNHIEQSQKENYRGAIQFITELKSALHSR